MTDSTRLAAALAALGWHQAELARVARVSRPAAHYWMVGVNHPPAALLEWLEERAALVAQQRPAPEWRRH